MNQTLMLLGWSFLVALLLGAVVWGLCRIRWLRQRPALRHGLWLLVLVKLVVPSFVSVVVLPAQFAPETGDVELAAADFPQYTEFAGETLGVPPLNDGFAEVNQQAIAPRTGGGTLMNAAWQTLSDRGGRLAFYVLLALSLGVSCLLGMTAILKCRKMQRLVCGSSVPASRAGALLSQVAESFRLKQPPRVLVVDAQVTPMLWGVPRQCGNCLAAGAYSIRSTTFSSGASWPTRMAHFVRRDHWASTFAFCVTTLLWWNPVAWLARRQLAEAAESSCDALVVERLPGSRKCYAETLLYVVDYLAATPSRRLAVAIPFGESRSLRRRFECLADARVTARVSRLGWMLLALVATISLLVPARAQQAAVEPAAPSNAVAETPAGESQTPKDAEQTDESKEEEAALEDTRLPRTSRGR